MRAILTTAFVCTLLCCGSPASAPPAPPAPLPGIDAGPPPAATSIALPPAASCVDPAELAAWQAEIDSFDGGWRPTGSAAHERYIQRLAEELAKVGVEDVHTEPYAFEKWTPSSYSLALLDGASTPIAVSAYAPYSGTTGPLGVAAPLAYVPGFTVPLDAGAVADALHDPAKVLAPAIEARLAASAGALVGRIVVFELPRVALSLGAVVGTTLAVNDPGHTISLTDTLVRDDLSAMLAMPAMLNALASAGALGAVGILDAPEEAARGEYAPFFGTLSPNVPTLYVDRDVGATLKKASTTNGARLVLDATVSAASSENLVGVMPGASDEEIILGSHTDGPNAIEDNGPVAILALAKCLAHAPRPRTIRVVLSGGHFAGSRGLQTYVAEHTADLTAHALAVMELEHLGAREWSEVAPGVMGLTGRPEVQVVYTSSNAPLVAASKAFAGAFPRSVVGTPPLLGEGQNFRIVPLVQLIAMPRYLLNAGLPVTTVFTDFDLMRRQVVALLGMEQALAVAPASALGVTP